MTSSNGNLLRVTGPLCFRHKGQWRGALKFSLICAWTNNRNAGDLWCHRAHYDVTAMSNISETHIYREILFARSLFLSCQLVVNFATNTIASLPNFIWQLKRILWTNKISISVPDEFSRDILYCNDNSCQNKTQQSVNRVHDFFHVS